MGDQTMGEKMTRHKRPSEETLRIDSLQLRLLEGVIFRSWRAYKDRELDGDPFEIHATDLIEHCKAINNREKQPVWWYANRYSIFQYAYWLNERIKDGKTMDQLTLAEQASAKNNFVWAASGVREWCKAIAYAIGESHPTMKVDQ